LVAARANPNNAVFQLMKTFLLALFVVLFAAVAPAADYTALSPEFSAVTASGTVTKGAHFVTFKLSSDFAGSILGQAIVAGTVPNNEVRFETTNDHVLPDIAYTRTAGTLWIVTVR
jgi:opacity protein-like surface antigen